MTDDPNDAGPPHVTIEFVGGPFCGAVVDSQVQSLRAALLRRLVSAARSDHPAELRLRQASPRQARVEATRTRGVMLESGRDRLHRYRLLVELGFDSRVLFRAEYEGVEVAPCTLWRA